MSSPNGGKKLKTVGSDKHYFGAGASRDQSKLLKTDGTQNALFFDNPDIDNHSYTKSHSNIPTIEVDLSMSEHLPRINNSVSYDTGLTNAIDTEPLDAASKHRDKKKKRHHSKKKQTVEEDITTKVLSPTGAPHSGSSLTTSLHKISFKGDAPEGSLLKLPPLAVMPTKDAEEKSMTSSKSYPLDKSMASAEKTLTQFLGNHTKHLTLKQRETAQYVSSKIKQRECCHYVSKASTKDKCCCNRPKQWHVERRLPIDDQKAQKWDPEKHTVTMPCDSFGDIHFRGFGTTVANSPYARVDIKTDPAIVHNLLINYWKMPPPRLLISVTGGAQRFELMPRLSTLLKRGLVGAAINTGAWIITGGTASGVMEFVGEAVRDHMTVRGRSNDESCVALGIAPWGCVANNLALDGEGEQGLWPATYAIEDVVHQPKGYTSLDPNHSHFILVDNGCDITYGAEISFRTQLESYISNAGTTGASETQDMNIPVVLIVVEGGVGTMDTFFQSIERKTPVVVINGSGRAADFIALAFRMTSDPTNPDHSKFPSDFKSTLTQSANRIFVWKTHDINKDKKIEECIDNLKKALKEHRSLINIYDLEKSESAEDIDRAILYALLKANKFDCKSQLALALAWNRCDIARQQIFIPENRSSWKVKDLYDAMFTALVQDRPDFVQLFLDNGVDLRKFLTVKTLWNLYCHCLEVEDDGEATILRHMIMFLKQGWGAYLRRQALEEWRDFPKDEVLECINKVIIYLLADEGFEFYIGEKYKVKNEKITMEWKGDSKSIQPLLSRLETADQTGHDSEGHEQFEIYEDNTDESYGGHMSRSRKMKQKLKMKENFDFEFPERDLFIFAILFNRRHMADMFLQQGIDPIGTSLFGCSLLRALSDKATEEEETSTSLDLMSHSETLESFAVNVLDVCYLRSKMNTHLLLCRTLKHLGNMAILVLVDRQKLMDLAEHSACQTKLSSIWKGNVALHTSELRILMTIFFPPLIYFMKFHTTEKSSSSLTSEVDVGSAENQPYLDTNKVNPATDSAVFSPSKKKPKDTTLRSKLQEVRMFCGDGNSINLLEAAYKFYRTPVTKFLNNIIASLIFLALFSYFLLTDINPMENGQRPSVVEYIVWIWFLTMIFEEIRQICVSDQLSLKYKFQSWWSSFWNQFDFVMCLGMILSVILRFELMTESHFVYVRIVYSITLVMSYLRFMQYFFAEKNMGPKVIMIRKMLTDLMFFFLILSVFLVSFGVAYHINMFPNSPDSWSILYRVFYYPYFQLQGNIFLEDMQGEDVNDCTRNQTLWMSDPASRCPEKNAITLIFCALYLVLTNILLVNLLIAMFSCTFQNVQNVSTKVWHFYRISLIYEYLDRPSLVPPIIFLNHLWRALRHLLIKKGYMSTEHNAFRVPLSDEVNLRLSLFEKEAMEVYLANSSIREREQLDSRVASTAERLEIVMDDLKRIKEAVQQQEKGLNSAEQIVTPAKSIPLGASTTSIVSQSDVTPRITAQSSSISPGDEIVLQAQLKDLQQQTSLNSLRLMELTAMLEKSLKQKD